MAARTPVVQGPVLPTRKQFNEWLEQQIALNPQFIPPNQLCLEDIDEWQLAKDELARVKAKEALLRSKVYTFLFTAPVEGTNYVQIANGPKLKATRKIDRKPDQAQIDVMKKLTVGEMRTFLTQLKIDHTFFEDSVPVVTALNIAVDKLLEYKPELVTKEYRELTAEQRAVFEMCLVIKDGSPQLEIAK